MHKMSAFVAAVALIPISFSAGASAEEATPWWEAKLVPEPFSVTLAFTTDYRFRGISQTNRTPAYQGNFDFEKEIHKDSSTSIYAGVFASNVDFADATSEVDLYGGFKGKLSDLVSWNLQLIGYLYPGAASNFQYDYVEVNPSLGWDLGFMEVTTGVALSPDYFAGSGFGAYPNADMKVPIPIDAVAAFKPALVGHVGYQFIEDNVRFGTPDYWDWNLGLAASVFGFNVSFKYYDTNLSQSQCAGSNLCRPAAIFTVSHTF